MLLAERVSLIAGAGILALSLFVPQESPSMAQETHLVIQSHILPQGELPLAAAHHQAPAQLPQVQADQRTEDC